MTKLGSGTLHMRAWTKCFRTKYVGVTLGDFAWHFKKYKRWFEFRSLIMPGRRIRWK